MSEKKSTQLYLGELSIIKAKIGSIVKVRYTVRLGNGTLSDISNSREPLEFTIGSGEVLEGLENGILGMEPGEKKRIIVLPEVASGPRREALIGDVKKSKIAENVIPSIGFRLEIQQPDGDLMNGINTELNEDPITIDPSHPMSERSLIFDIELLGVT